MIIAVNLGKWADWKGKEIGGANVLIDWVRGGVNEGVQE